MGRVTRNRLILGVVLLVLLVSGVWLFERWSYNNPVITITTDSTPTALRIGDKQLSLADESTEIRLKRREYNYLATYNANRIYGSLDTLEKKDISINLKFQQYSLDAVRRAICELDSVELGSCEYTIDRLSVKFLGDNSWALVKYLPPDRGKINYIALRQDNGRWTKIADSDDYGKDFKGLVPEYVSREVR